MSSFVHGVTFEITPTGLVATVEATAGLNFVVCTAPVHTLPGATLDGQPYTNVPLLCNNYADAVAQLGVQTGMTAAVSGLWTEYSALHHVDLSFDEFNNAPVVYLNIVDPTANVTTVAPSSQAVTSGEVILPGTTGWKTVYDSVVVKNSGGTTTYVLNTDYTLGYDSNGNMIVTVLSTGSIGSATTLQIGWNNISLTAITSSTVIGSVSGSGVPTGLFCIENVYPMFALVPGIIICPAWSNNAAVAAAMLARGLSVNNCFVAESFIDADSSTVTSPSGVNSWKTTNNVTAPDQILCWPQIYLSGGTYNKQYPLASALAVSCQSLDAANHNVPIQSPSNQYLPMTGTCLANGTPIVIAKPNADYLNSIGVVTALLWTNGWKAWGNYTSCYPGQTDPSKQWISVRRTFNWIGNTLILTIFQFVDDPTNYQLIQSITQTVQLWLNALVNQNSLLGARIVFNQNQNPVEQLINGQFVFQVFIGSPVPAQNIQFQLTFDTSYLSTLFQSNTSALAA